MCSSKTQPNALSCRDRAMQHCQQAPVSNEFSTAVLADSVAVRGRHYLFSIAVTPGSVTLCHGIIWSGGPFSLCDLAWKSRVRCISASTSHWRVAPPSSHFLLFLPLSVQREFTFGKTGVKMGLSCPQVEDTSSIRPPPPPPPPPFLLQVSNSRTIPPHCHCLCLKGQPRLAYACGVDKLLALFPAGRQAQTHRAMAWNRAGPPFIL